MLSCQELPHIYIRCLASWSLLRSFCIWLASRLVFPACVAFRGVCLCVCVCLYSSLSTFLSLFLSLLAYNLLNLSSSIPKGNSTPIISFKTTSVSPFHRALPISLIHHHRIVMQDAVAGIGANMTILWWCIKGVGECAGTGLPSLICEHYFLTSQLVKVIIRIFLFSTSSKNDYVGTYLTTKTTKLC